MVYKELVIGNQNKLRGNMFDAVNKSSPATSFLQLSLHPQKQRQKYF